MADIHFEEACPCGNVVKISGYTSEVRTHVTNWHRIHDKHANAISKALTAIGAAKEIESHPLIRIQPREGSDYDLINVDVAEPMFGAQVGKTMVRTHGKSQCAGPPGENGEPVCCIHNPSDHHMREWPQNWRADKGMMERFCTHGIGHPDPDDLAVRTTEWAGVHGCDGCCARAPKDEPDAPQKSDPESSE